MRFIILLSSFVIAKAINPEVTAKVAENGIWRFVFLTCIVCDIVELASKFVKKK